MAPKAYKENLQSYLAILTFVALLMLIGIQVAWILKAAKFEENEFNNKVATSLKHAKMDLRKRASSCSNMNNYLQGNCCQLPNQNKTIHEIDSILKWHLAYNNIELKYDFSIGDSLLRANEDKLFNSKCYFESLNGLMEDKNIDLYIRFPSRNQFLFAQMKGWFIVSILAILFIAASFYIMLKLFMREKAILIRTTDFINNMVHEFQTPLANIKFASNLIRKKNSDVGDKKINEYASVIDSETCKLERNVEQILKLATPAALHVSDDKVNMNHLINTVIDQYQYQFDKQACTVNLNLNALHCTLMGKKEQLQLLISNLIDNALKYSPINSILTIATRNHQNNLIISIADTGIGIDKNNVPFIFDKYYRVSTGDVHNVKGFGLGLTFAKKIVDMHHGNINVTSELGKGTEFEITFTVTNEQ